MLYIKYLSIDSLATEITVELIASEGETISKVSVWNEETYGDSTLSIDRSSKLAGDTSREVFTVTAEDLGQDIEGIFYFEFTVEPSVLDTCVTEPTVVLGVVANLLKYYNCILNKVLELEVDKCQFKEPGECEESALYLNILLENLLNALNYGFYEEANILIADLKKSLCDCLPCENTVGKIVTGTTYSSSENIFPTIIEDPCDLSVSLSLKESDTIISLGGTSYDISVVTENENLTYEWSTGETGTSISVAPSVTTIYTVEATDESGCTTTASLTLVIEEEECNLDIQIVEEYDGEGSTLFVQHVTDVEAPILTYLWSTGETTPFIYIFAYTPTTYTVTVTNSEGCSVTESVVIDLNDSTFPGLG